MPPSVLLVGLADGQPNQFSRKLEKYGCKVERLNGDPGRVPDRHDACILIKCAVSHTKFYQVKNVYSGKRLFVTNNGFSEIREGFEDFLFKFQGNTMPLTLAPSEVKIEEPTPAPETEIVAPAIKLTKRQRIVKECDEANMSTKETIAMLMAEGETIQSGREFTNIDVYTYRNQYKAKLKDASETPVEPKVKIKKAEPKLEVKTDWPLEGTAPKPLIDPTALINMVLASDMFPVEKLRRIKEITEGKLTAARGVASYVDSDVNGEFLAVKRFDITKEKSITHLGLTREECKLIIECAEAISNFALEVKTESK